jgi:hypothetical protein
VLKQYGKYYAVLMGLYIVAHTTDLGSKVTAGAQGFATVTKSIQGRD